VRAAVRPAGAAWQPAVELAARDNGTSFPQVAVDTRGNAIASWEHYDGIEKVAQAAFLPAGGSWQPPVNLSGAGGDAGIPRIAFDAHGDAVAVWTRYAAGASVVQSAARPAAGT